MIRVLAYLLVLMLMVGCGTSGKPASAESQSHKQSLDVVTFSQDSCMKHLKAQVDFGPRVPGSAAHKHAAAYLENALKGYGATVTVQTSSTVTSRGNKIPVYNIFGQYNADCKTRILLLAHWDTRPWADEDPNPDNHSKPIDGANDGASGVAVLLEIARLVNLCPPENVGVDILFVDAEDSGDEGDDESWCLGTRLWVKQMPYSGDNRPQYAILLDMVGGRDARFHREFISDYYARSVVDRVWSMANVSGYSSRFINETGNAITDDHLPLIRAGIPTVDIIENKNQYTGSFNPTWHTLQDNVANIDPQTLRVVGQVVANCIYNHK